MKLFGKELFGKKSADEASPSSAPVPRSAPSGLRARGPSKTPESGPSKLPESGAGWYIAADTTRRLRQVVIDLPNSKAMPSEFGILMLPGKYLSLLSSNWVAGLFPMGGKPGLYLLIRADDDVEEFKTSPTKIAFSFFKTQSGAMLRIYIYVDSEALRAKRSQRHVFIEINNGLEVPEYVRLVEDVLQKDLITVVLAAGGASTTSIMNASGESQSFSPPAGRYDIRLSLERACRESLWRELRELDAFNASIAPEQRSFAQSLNAVRQLMPETENPLLRQGA